MEPPYAYFWTEAVWAGYATAADWQNWADRVIRAMPEPPEWVLEMCVAKSADELLEALCGRAQREIGSGTLTQRAAEVRAGYYWLRFRRGDMTLWECLKECGDWADGSSQQIHCEYFYDPLNRLEA